MTHAIVASARGWLGTRFHHQGRVKRTSNHLGGVDCLGLLVGVAAELDLRNSKGIALASCDERHYPHQPDCVQLFARLDALLEQVPCNAIKPADILLLNVDGNPQHLAIVTDYNDGLGIIHAYASARAVVEHALDEQWRTAMKAAFQI